jgi:hypothetical protein
MPVGLFLCYGFVSTALCWLQFSSQSPGSVSRNSCDLDHLYIEIMPIKVTFITVSTF